MTELTIYAPEYVVGHLPNEEDEPRSATSQLLGALRRNTTAHYWLKKVFGKA